MKHRIFILTILALGLVLSGNAQEKPKPKNCDQYLTESTGSAVRPDDGWCNYDGAYARCQCENDQIFKRWRQEFDKNNRLAKEDKERLIQLEKSIIDRTKAIRDLNLNEGNENFVENKNKAIQIYEQAISQLSSLQVNYVNDENTNLKQNRVTLEKTKRQHIEYWKNEIALLKSKNPTKKVEFSFDNETTNREITNDETTQAPHRGGNAKPLTELKGDLLETKAMLERTGQTDTEEYRKTVASLNAVEQQLSRRNNDYSGTSRPTKPTYSQTMRETQREINRTNQAFDQAKDAFDSFAEQKQKNIEQARRELRRDEEEWKKQLAEKEEHDRKRELERERKYRKNSKVTREYLNDLQQKTIEDFKFYKKKEKLANVTTEIKLYNVTEDKHDFFPSGRAYISLEKFIELLPNLEELELTYYLGNTFPKNIRDLKKLKKLIFDTYSGVDISLVDGKLVARPNEEFVLPSEFFELENLEYLEFRFSTFTDDYTRYRTIIKFLDTASFKKFKKLKVVKVTDSYFLNATLFQQLVKNPSIEKIIIDDTLEQFKWNKWKKKFLKNTLKYTPITFEFKDEVLKGKSSTNQLANQN